MNCPSLAPASRRFLLPAILAGSIAAVSAQAQSIFYQAPTGPNGTWNLYEYVLTGTTFANAHQASDGITTPLGGATLGYLVQINDAFENGAVNNMAYRGDAWIGLTDRVGVAGGSEGSFRWTNGQPLTYANFNPGEPNDAGGEDAVHITPGGGWNDNKSGYTLNLPVVDPTNLEESAAPSFRYVRKWEIQSPTPLPAVRSAALLSFPGTVSSFAPAPTPGNFGVREIRDLTLDGNLGDTVTKVLSGAGTIYEAQRPILDTADPDSNAPGGPVLTTPPLPYISDTPGINDDNIITVANGKVSVPSSGLWTIQVRADDGFALRVVGQSFSSVNGAGGIDPVDSSTIFFAGGTGDTNTRGVINLNAGVYDIEFVNWEGGGGAYYEVTTAKGAVANAGDAQWLAMGNNAVIPAKPNILRLNGSVTVQTAGEGAGFTANNITEARTLITVANGGTVPLNSSSADSVTIGDGQAVPFPLGTPADEFATKVFGNFLLDDGDGTLGESLTITFGLFSDDGSQLRILGQDFDLATDFTADGVAGLVDVDGDLSLTADYFTGNTNAFGRITLTEGNYDFEAFMYEGGGGANISILYALGDKTATGLDSDFISLTTSTGLPGNEGWELVPEPGTGLLALVGTSLVGLRRRRNRS